MGYRKMLGFQSPQSQVCITAMTGITNNRSVTEVTEDIDSEVQSLFIVSHGGSDIVY